MLRFGSDHPVGTVAASIAQLVDDPENLHRYIVSLSEINSDTVSGLEIMKERTRKWARNQYLACQRTKDANSPSSKGTHPHKMIRVESQSVYWAQNLLMQNKDSDKLAELWLHRNFPEDFEQRTLGYLEVVKALGAQGVMPPPFEKIIETVYVGWLADYYEDQENWPKVWEYGTKGLSMADGEQYQLWSIHLEGLMDKHGAKEQAAALRKKRREHQWFDTVREKLDKLSLG